MKKVFSFFSRQEEDGNTVMTYRPKEPTLRPTPTVHPRSVQTSINRYSGGARQARPARPEEQEPAAPPREAGVAAQPGAGPDMTRPKIAGNAARAGEPASATPVPTGYADLVAYFNRTVAERKSPYNALVQAADRLKEFIPNETARLQAALAICGDRWSPDALSLAINAHLSDIEAARKKAHSGVHGASAERAASLRAEAGDIRERSARLRSEIAEVKERLEKLEATVRGNDERLATLDAQIRDAESSASSAGFVDQAAENLKNDLLAKKVILGLP